MSILKRFLGGRGPSEDEETSNRESLTISLAEILANPELLARPVGVVGSLVLSGRVTLLSAREKAGKSTVAAAMAAAVSRGVPFLDVPTTRGCVVWLGVEEALEAVANRFADLGAAPEDLHLVRHVKDPLADLRRVIRLHRPSLMVVDTLPTLLSHMPHPPESGASMRWAGIMRQITALAREYECGLLLLHHARRADGGYRDSTAIGAGVDMILEMRVERNGARRLSAKGRWQLDDMRFRLDLELNVYHRLTDGSQSELEERIIKFVRQNPGCSAADLRSAVTGKNDGITKATHSLIERGFLRKETAGRAWALYAQDEALRGVA